VIKKSKAFNLGVLGCKCYRRELYLDEQKRKQARESRAATGTHNTIAHARRRSEDRGEWRWRLDFEADRLCTRSDLAR
jgi:hypothetical protein